MLVAVSPKQGTTRATPRLRPCEAAKASAANQENGRQPDGHIPKLDARRTSRLAVERTVQVGLRLVVTLQKTELAPHDAHPTVGPRATHAATFRALAERLCVG